MFQGLRPVEVLGKEVTDVLFPGHPINNQLVLMHPVLNKAFCFDTLGSERVLGEPLDGITCTTAGQQRGKTLRVYTGVSSGRKCTVA